ncbi:MAG: carboxy terminal-processing peptidase [Pseudomonadota bacterium]|nr:carboxy terminal-processing peptidase [Pseudomonadota bacterium]
MKYIVVLMAMAWVSQSASALSCLEIKRAIEGHYFHKGYLDLHIKYDKFSDALSKRTFDNFVERFDPGKLYLLKGDFDYLRKRYERKLDDQIMQSNCTALDAIVNRIAKGHAKIKAALPAIIKAEHDFTIDEKMQLNRKELSYAKTDKELRERWRKWIKFQLLRLKSATLGLDEARNKLTKRYQLEQQRFDELDDNDIKAAFLSSFANALDPHSDYFSMDELEDFQIRTRLSLEGIGAVLRSDEGFTIIQSLVPGGAADKSGLLRENDKIIAVAQAKGSAEDIIDMDLREVVKLIRGKRGTPVHLTVLRGSGKKIQELNVKIVREKIELKDQAVSAKVFELQTEVSGTQGKKFRVGVATLPSFYIDFEGRRQGQKDYTSSSRDLKQALQRLQGEKGGIDALVLDLRNNGGGSLDEAVAVSGLFIDKGVIVHDKLASGEPRAHHDTEAGVSFAGALVVLINRSSASGSEIVAGAIKDYRRGVIVGGSHTYGKGTVQSLTELKGVPGALKVTISKFYRPAGASTQKKGVAADIALPSFADDLEMGEKFLDNVLAWAAIKPQSKFKRANKVDRQKLAWLATRSKERVDSSEEFKQLLTKIAEFRKERETENSVSLQAKDDEQADNSSDKDSKDTTATAAKDKDGTGDTTEDEEAKDIIMHEALHIAADYAKLLAGKKPVKIVEIKELP